MVSRNIKIRAYNIQVVSDPLFKYLPTKSDASVVNKNMKIFIWVKVSLGNPLSTSLIAFCFKSIYLFKKSTCWWRYWPESNFICK